jgi:GTP-binding protein
MAPPPRKPRIASAEFVASAPHAGAFPPPVGVEIAFLGRSNVGKSTLLNAVLERKSLARTSSTPGATREVVFFEAKTTSGAVLSLADLPGYGYAKRSKAERESWGALAEDYLLGRANLAGVVILVDARRGLEDDDRDLFELIASKPRVTRAPLKATLVATKLDKINAAARKPALAKLKDQAKRPIVGFSMEDPTTADDVWRAVMKMANLGDAPQ